MLCYDYTLLILKIIYRYCQRWKYLAGSDEKLDQVGIKKKKI